MWVYSGCRGVHCWVSDDKVIHADADIRKAILSYLTVIKVRQLIYITHVYIHVT